MALVCSDSFRRLQTVRRSPCRRATPGEIENWDSGDESGERASETKAASTALVFDSESRHLVVGILGQGVRHSTCPAGLSGQKLKLLPDDEVRSQSCCDVLERDTPDIGTWRKAELE